MSQVLNDLKSALELIKDKKHWTKTANGYQVNILGGWKNVPPGAIRNPRGGPNPTGHAIVWYLDYGGDLVIYCFAPGFQL